MTGAMKADLRQRCEPLSDGRTGLKPPGQEGSQRSARHQKAQLAASTSSWLDLSCLSKMRSLGTGLARKGRPGTPTNWQAPDIDAARPAHTRTNCRLTASHQPATQQLRSTVTVQRETPAKPSAPYRCRCCWHQLGMMLRRTGGSCGA